MDSPEVTRQKMYDAVLALQPGEVVSYGDIAARAGRPEASRMAGQVLSESLDCLPWWRVVYSDGRFPPCRPGLQEERLTAEGVEVIKLRVIRSPKGRFQKSNPTSPT